MMHSLQEIVRMGQGCVNVNLNLPDQTVTGMGFIQS